MSKYEPLKAFLAARHANEVPMTFGEIEAVIGAPLPPVAHKYRAWWSNNPSNSVITNAWLDAGYKTERVDMGGQKLVFRRQPSAPPAKSPAPVSGGGLLARIQARLGGTATVMPGVDLTAPTGETWDAEQ